ncbi:MAG: P1 family peptidase [Hungatella sp.]|nr:P1 family peptidase [Hungatella sp.]
MKRIREYGIITGRLIPGPLNKITDVEGVLVGHTTIDTRDHKTGVTVIVPCKDNPFRRKLVAAAYIHNGFGKSDGGGSSQFSCHGKNNHRLQRKCGSFPDRPVAF